MHYFCWINELLRKHWRLSMIFKKSNKNVWSNVFWYVKVCIFWKGIQYTIHWHNTQMLKKIPLDKINGTKIPSFFFCELSTSFTFNLRFLHELEICPWFVPLKLCVGVFIFDSILFLLKLIFCLTKCMNYLILKHHNSFQN